MPHELSSAYFLTIQLHLFVYFLAYSPGLCLSFSPSYLNIPHSLGGLGLWRYWYLCLKCLPLVASTSFSYYLINTFVVVQSLSCAQLFATPWTAARLPSLSFTISLSLLKLMSFELVMPSKHLILCHPLFLLPSIFPSISDFSSESALGIWWPKYWNFNFSISPSNEYSALISLRIDYFDLLSVQGTLKSLIQHQFVNTNYLVYNFLYDPTLTSIHDYWKNHSFDYTAFAGKVMSLIFNMLSRLVIAFLPRSQLLLISWLQPLSTVILEPKKIKSVIVSIVSPSICHEVMGLDAMI